MLLPYLNKDLIEAGCDDSVGALPYKTLGKKTYYASTPMENPAFPSADTVIAKAATLLGSSSGML